MKSNFTKFKSGGYYDILVYNVRDNKITWANRAMIEHTTSVPPKKKEKGRKNRAQRYVIVVTMKDKDNISLWPYIDLKN